MISIPQDSDRFVNVHNVFNGITLDTKQILVGDLIYAFMDQLDDHLHLAYLLNNNPLRHLIPEVLRQVEDNDSEQLEDIFGAMLDVVDFDPSDQKVVALMDKLIEHLRIRNLQPAQLAKILSMLLKGIESISDKENLQLMFLLLADKLSFFDYPEGDLLKETSQYIYRQAASLNVESVNRIFFDMAKVVSPQTVMKAAAPYQEEYVVTTPILPKSCVFYQESRNRIRVGIEVEKGNHDVIFGEIEESLYKQVAYPKLLFWFDINKSMQVLSANVVAVKDLLISEETELYRFPYSNVFESGKICWTIKSDPYSSLRQLEILPYIFLGATKNMDLYEAAHDINLRDLLEFMQEKVFDDSLLIPMNKKVKDITLLGG